MLIGIEDDADAPASGQIVDPTLTDTLRRKIGERTVNVAVLPEIQHADNGGEYFELRIPRSRIRRTVEELVAAGKLQSEGVRNGTRYTVTG